MSQYYNSQRVKGLYDPASANSAKGGQAFKLSRSKIDLFISCQRCFYLDRRLGVGRPPGYQFTLNSAVDALLKKEFDIHRANGTKHPLMEKYGVDAQPIPHEDLDRWRHNFTGIQYLHEPTNLLITGAIDDLWARPLPNPSQTRPLPNPPLIKGRGELEDAPLRKGEKFPELIVVDYKATAKAGEITELDQDWQDSYKRQMEVYQWLLRQNGYRVSDTGYFVYCNGRTDREAFDGKLEFDITLIPYTGNDSWVEKTIFAIHKCLNGGQIPEADPACDYCNYQRAVLQVEKK